MIKIKSSEPMELNFICKTEDEKEFVDSNWRKVFDEFICLVSCGRFKNYDDYYQYVCSATSHYEILKMWQETKCLTWNSRLIGRFEEFINDKYFEFKCVPKINIEVLYGKDKNSLH